MSTDNHPDRRVGDAGVNLLRFADDFYDPLPPVGGLRAIASATLLLLAALAWLYQDIIQSLVTDWGADPNNSHGYMVPVISLYLLWDRRHLLAKTEAETSWVGAGVLILSVFTLLVGSIGAELFLQRISLVGVLLGLVWFNLGTLYARRTAFPILLLALAIPLPAIVLNTIAFPLQLFAAQCAEWALQGLSIPVFREGNVIHLTYTTLEVAEACSGIRSLVSLLVLAVVFSYMSQKGAWARTILTLSAIPIAVFTNAARVGGTGILAHYFGESAAQGFYHTFSGWLVFVVALLILAVESTFLRAILRGPGRRTTHVA